MWHCKMLLRLVGRTLVRRKIWGERRGVGCRLTFNMEELHVECSEEGWWEEVGGKSSLKDIG